MVPTEPKSERARKSSQENGRERRYNKKKKEDEINLFLDFKKKIALTPVLMRIGLLECREQSTLGFVLDAFFQRCYHHIGPALQQQRSHFNVVVNHHGMQGSRTRLALKVDVDNLIHVAGDLGQVVSFDNRSIQLSVIHAHCCDSCRASNVKKFIGFLDFFAQNSTKILTKAQTDEFAFVTEENKCLLSRAKSWMNVTRQFRK